MDSEQQSTLDSSLLAVQGRQGSTMEPPAMEPAFNSEDLDVSVEDTTQMMCGLNYLIYGSNNYEL